ncbi:putative membrane protein [Friedmanniella luteola]|uniref:Putative membrane protein n=1 Tax=Friedmanniella luteola TaxID=546871 RepID=A0A1H1MUF6_9ACTN|nr:hypothetical protein [Friedmanniella luteola]SDR90513.1 putative membrane protein [Friedmanniella luteola]
MTPRDLGPGFHSHETFFVLPFLAALLVLVALTVAGLHLVRSGKLSLGGPARPEEEAKRVLAERFARGDIDGEEFMERSSLLNWTPGVAEVRPRLRRLRR